jgi:7-cyano-7-deazaguanine synthase
MAADATVSRMVLLSGGVDSACLLALCGQQRQRDAVQALFVDYGQAATKPEGHAAAAVAAAFGVRLGHASVNIGPIEIGEIPGRNALLVHLAVATAGAMPVAIMLGIHAGTSYRDCSPDFVRALQASLDAHRDGAVQLVAPFVTWSKAEVYAYAQAMAVPLELTYSCEAGEVPPCGSCGSCQDREALDAGS